MTTKPYLDTGSAFVHYCESLRAGNPKRYKKVSPMIDLSRPELPDNWVWASLSQVCERVSVGHVGSTSPFFCDPTEGIPLIRSQDVRPGRLEIENAAYITREFHDSHKKSHLRGGDILIVRSGARRGDCCVVPDNPGHLNCANIVFARPVMPDGYLGYYFQSPLGRELLLSISTGSAQGVINTQSIARIPVPVPPLPVQKRIPGVLSAYDGLIENNRQRIAVLEAAAQALYREWFVEMRFPGWEDVEWVESELGVIPVGWKAAALRQVASLITRGYPPKYDDESDCRVINQKCIYDFKIDLSLTRGNNENQRPVNRFVAFGDMLINSTGTGTLGRVAQVYDDLVRHTIDSHITLVRPDQLEINIDYFGIILQDMQDIFEQMGRGATNQTELSITEVGELVILNPLRTVQDRFSELVRPMRQLIQELLRCNTLLRETRDRLLPRLISGEVSVEELPLPEEVE